MFLKGANGRRPFVIAVAEPRNAFRQPQIQMLPAVTTGVDLIRVAEQGYGFQQPNFSVFSELVSSGANLIKVTGLWVSATQILGILPSAGRS